MKDTEGEIAETTGWESNFVRLNLSVIKDSIIPYDIYFNAFIRSVSNINTPTIEEWKTEWKNIEDIIKSMGLDLPNYDEDKILIDTNLEKGDYVGHHSKIFEDSYSPHYRIITTEIYINELLPIISDADNKKICPKTN